MQCECTVSALTVQCQTLIEALLLNEQIDHRTARPFPLNSDNQLAKCCKNKHPNFAGNRPPGKLCTHNLLPVMSVFLSLSFFQWRRPSATGAPSVIVDSKCCSVAPVGARTPRNFEITLKAWCHAGGCCREN